MEIKTDRIEIVSDINERDGIGIEVYRNNEMVLEIFRDDTEMTRTVKVYKKDISLELIKESIQAFKKEIPWEFIKY